MKDIIEQTLQMKLDKGLPLSSAEFGRLARQLAEYVKQLERELNELKVSVSRSRLDPDNEGMGSASRSYDPEASSEGIARSFAYTAGKLDILAKLEAIIRLRREIMSRLSDLYRQVSQMRERQFHDESLGNLGMFYRDTARDYEKKMLEARQKFQGLYESWENKFAQAEKLFANDPKAKLIGRSIGNERRQIIYSTLPVDVFLDEQGQRRPLSEVRNRIKRYDKKLANKLDPVLMAEMDVSEYTKSYETYQRQFEQEQEALAARNEEARKKFTEDKQKFLSKAEAGSYRGATYVEKPL